MTELKEAVIISAKRTPTGKFQGLLKDITAPELGAKAITAAIEKAGIKNEDVDEVIMGCVVQAGIGQAPARQAALKSRTSAGSFGFDGQYGLRFGTSRGCAGGAGDSTRRFGNGCGGRNGINVEYSVCDAEGA